jgi:hypothetical protein
LTRPTLEIWFRFGRVQSRVHEQLANIDNSEGPVRSLYFVQALTGEHVTLRIAHKTATREGRSGQQRKLGLLMEEGM